jgi:hypothetical protein
VVAQDGMRVRANAGAASFRRKTGLQRCLKEARQQVKAVRAELDHDDSTRSDRQRAAQERAVRERQQLVQEALEELKEVQSMRGLDDDDDETETLRASTTDPEARVMRMPDGGFRPGYNVQVATDTEDAGDRRRAGDQQRQRPWAADADAGGHPASHRPQARADARRPAATSNSTRSSAPAPKA